MSCPISFEPKINSNVLRINSFFYLSFLILGFVTQNALFITPLVFIFIMKNINIHQECMLDKLSEFIQINLFKNTNPEMIDPAPKKIANILGLVGSIALLLTTYFQLDLKTVPYAAMSIAFSLELVFNYCLGCKLYEIYNSITRK